LDLNFTKKLEKEINLKMFNFKIAMLSLRIRIFLSMIVLIIMASVILASISIFQFKNEKEYHQELGTK
jgi:hypothetical protein